MNLQNNREIFKAVDGFDNYEISSFGRVRNVQTARILKHSVSGSGGYHHVALCRKGKRISSRIHRLVADAFCDNPNNNVIVDHIDRNIENNHYENIRWVTSSENSRNRNTSTNNSSGIQGVSFDKTANAWKVSINNDESHKISKSFSINKYSNAKELAIAQRHLWEHEFNYIGG